MNLTSIWKNHEDDYWLRVLTSFRPQVLSSRTYKTTEVKGYVIHWIEGNNCLYFIFIKFKEWNDPETFVFVRRSIESLYVTTCSINIFKKQENDGNQGIRHTLNWGQSESLLHFHIVQGINTKIFCNHIWRFNCVKLYCFITFIKYL